MLRGGKKEGTIVAVLLINIAEWIDSLVSFCSAVLCSSVCFIAVYSKVVNMLEVEVVADYTAAGFSA